MRTLLLLPIIALLMLTGCAAKYEAKTDYQLCYDKATQPLVGPAKQNRQAEIKSRGLNCKKYAARIDREVSAVRQAKASAPRSTSISNNPFKVSNPYENKSSNDTCYVNRSGRVISCF